MGKLTLVKKKSKSLIFLNSLNFYVQ